MKSDISETLKILVSATKEEGQLEISPLEI